MRSKDQVLAQVSHLVLDNTPQEITRLWVQYCLIEVLLDIRDALVTDCKDAMNALIVIRGGDKHEI